MPNHFIRSKKTKRVRGTIDHLIYGVVIIGPMTNLPQLFQIWVKKNAGSVSVISWSSFALLSFVWLIYGIVHKEKPLILMNAALVIIQATIAISAFLYK